MTKVVYECGCTAGGDLISPYCPMHPTAPIKPEIQEGQIWRKAGPRDWLRIETIHEPGRPDYDGGMIGCSVTYFPPQLKGIQLRGGTRMFFAGHDWRDQVMDHTYLLRDGWTRGESAWDSIKRW